MSVLSHAQDISALALRAAASGLPPAGIFLNRRRSGYQLRQHCADILGQRGRAAVGTDMDLCEEAFCTGAVAVIAKQGDLETDRRCADMGDPDPRGQDVGKAEFGMVAAAAFYNEEFRYLRAANHHPLVHLPKADGRVEKCVIGGVVEMAVCVVVLPARG